MDLDHIYLSPHLDDAALCCGASIALQVARGESVEVWTVFAGQPPLGELSHYAQRLHQAAGGPKDLVAARRAADEAACARQGATPVHWDYLDAPYRTDPSAGTFLYQSDEQLMSWHIHPVDMGLIDELSSSVWQPWSGTRRARLYAPLGAGGHVDHLIVRGAGLELERRGCDVTFYEDFPYVEDGHMLAHALTIPPAPGWSAHVRLLPESAVSAKCEAIAHYRSQIGILFGDTEGMVARVRSYMGLVGGAEAYGERFWRVCQQAHRQPERAEARRGRCLSPA